MRKSILVTLFVLMLYPLFAQQPYFSNCYTTIPGSEFAGAVVQNPDSGFVTVFYYDNPVRGYGFLRTDKYGDTIFTRRYGFAVNTRVVLGYSADALLRRDNGNYIAVGTLLDLTSSPPYPSSAFMIEFNSNGDTVRAWRYNGVGEDVLLGVCEDMDHNIVTCGYTSSVGSGGYDCWVMRFDSLFNVVSDTVYGGSQNDIGANIECTPDGGFMVGGRTAGRPYLIKLDSTLNAEWTRAYSSYEGTGQVALMPDSGYVFTCSAPGPIALGNPALVRVDSDGDVMWWHYYGVANYQNGFWSAPVVSGNYIAGAGVVADSGQYQHGYIVQTDLNGTVIWQRNYQLDSTGTAWLSDIEACVDGGYIAAGISPADYTGSWLLRIDSMGCEVPGCDGVGVTENSRNEIFVYPNPANSAIVFHSGSEELQQVILFDSFGRMIISESVSAPQHTINVESFAEGIYFYNIVEGGEVKASGKFIVQH